MTIFDPAIFDSAIFDTRSRVLVETWNVRPRQATDWTQPTHDTETWNTKLKQAAEWTQPTVDAETWNGRMRQEEEWWPSGLDVALTYVVDGNGKLVTDAAGRYVTANG